MLKELFIIYEEYMNGKQEIIGIFKDIEIAEYYKRQWGDDFFIKRIYTDMTRF